MRLKLLAIPAVLASGLAFATYAGSYDQNDIPTIVIDFLGTMGVQAVAFASLIALVVILAFVVNKAQKVV